MLPAIHNAPQIYNTCFKTYAMEGFRHASVLLFAKVNSVSVSTSLWGSPAAEKMGIFCPLAILFMPSMAEMPVWIISSG